MSNVDLIEKLYKAFGDGDIPTVLGAMSPEIEWREAEGNPYMPSGDPWIGPDAILENLFMKLGSEWDGFTVTPHSIHDAGSTVVAEGRYSGTYLATGAALDAQFCHIFKVEDGALTSFQQYVDTSRMQEAMGA